MHTSPTNEKRREKQPWELQALRSRRSGGSREASARRSAGGRAGLLRSRGSPGTWLRLHVLPGTEASSKPGGSLAYSLASRDSRWSGERASEEWACLQPPQRRGRG